MSLTHKVYIATAATAGVAVISYAKLKNYSRPLLGSWRMATLVLLILGLSTCIYIGSNISAIKGSWMSAGAAIGAVSLALAIMGLLFNNKTIFIVLSVSILSLWVLATVHHIVESTA